MAYVRSMVRKAPKAKKKGKKKSAAELEAERLALEEQMRLEEEGIYIIM